MKFQPSVRASILAAVAVFSEGCLPYTVASTARPARQDQTQVTASSFGVPSAYQLQSGNKKSTSVGLDVEARRGISPRSDVGLRLASTSGVVLSYKRRLDGASDKAGPGVAFQVGGGVLSYFSYAEGEAAIIVSGGEEGSFTPYGGFRGIYTAPLIPASIQYDPVYGGFLGFRWGSSQLGLSAELGIFRERVNAEQTSFFRPDQAHPRLTVIPSISLHADFIGWIDRIMNRNRR